MKFLDAFRLAARGKTRDGKTVAPGDITIWEGTLDGDAYRLRVTVRCRVAGESFLTSSNMRLRTTRTGEGGWFLDVVIARGPATAERRAQIAALIDAVERADAARANKPPRRVRVRAQGERLRPPGLGDIFDLTNSTESS
jgi:hypothetical protein